MSIPPSLWVNCLEEDEDFFFDDVAAIANLSSSSESSESSSFSSLSVSNDDELELDELLG